MDTRTRPLVLAVTLVAVLLGTTACIPLPSPLGPDAERLRTLAPTAAPTGAAPSDGGSSDADALGDAFAERDRFFEEQQLPRDGSLLVAVTPAQQAFIAAQREYIESQGATWTAQEESVSLALAADACETAILNGHDVDASTLEAHVATSPLFAALIPADADDATRTAIEGNLASTMVYGAGFLCPDDSVDWQSAYAEVYGY